MDTGYRFKVPFIVTEEMKSTFERDGFIIVRGLLDVEENKKLKFALETNEEFEKHAFNLLGDEVYHYHGKLMMKNAKTGGQFVWHQDYGYWYQTGNLYPDMMSVFIAIDPCTKDNGCLQVLQGSHRCGRIDHGPVGGQTGVDTDRIKEIRKICPLVHCELNTGDAIFFHCNLLHGSDANTSDTRRWAIIFAMNTKHNNPVVKHHCPQYSKLDIVNDAALKACDSYYDMTGKGFIDPKRATTIETDDD